MVLRAGVAAAEEKESLDRWVPDTPDSGTM